MVSMARRSISQDFTKFEKSWTKPQWIVPSVVSAPTAQTVEVFEGAVVRLGPGGPERLGSLFRSG